MTDSQWLMLSQTAQEDDMVYTQERLQRALDVFRASEPYRKRRGLSGNNIERLLESRCKQYETRSGKSSLAVRTTITGIWNDKDESGDYTPGRKRNLARTERAAQNGSKRKRCNVSRGDGKRGPKRTKVSYTSGRQKGLSLRVTLKFKCDATKAKVAELFPTTVPDAEPYQNGHYTNACDRDDGDGEKSPGLSACNEQSNFFPMYAPTSASSKVPVQCLGHVEADVQFTGSKDNGIWNEPSHHRLPTASESDPIIIDDSDDTGANYGDANANQTKMIKTNWAHPIDYRCKTEICNFCVDVRYSLFGYGEINVEVLQLQPGVFEEMGGGHRERGMAPTKICLNCSLERIAIAKCPAHEILRIDGCLEAEFDYQSFLNQIAASPHLEHPTCSICIKPAFYACGTRQKEDPFGFPFTGEDEGGCGLLLCGDCAGVVADYGLDMEHLERFAQSSKILRADRDFLLPGSDLWQAWRK